jgi:3-oxoacyl-[acyl-carrier protein] reductase
VASAPGIFDLSGRSAVVTGAARGIGRAVALELAGAGASVAVADLDGPGLDETVALLRRAGAAALGVRTDVSRREEVEALVAGARSEFGRLDVMANVAGVVHDAAVADTEEADLDRVLSVNLKGVYFGCQAAARAMSEAGSGSIVNMASSAAFQAIPGLSGYSMSKAAVVALTRVLAMELGPKGVRVNAIAPGFILSHMSARLVLGSDDDLDDAKLRALADRARESTPLGIEGRPEDVAHAVLYLATEASRYVTGQVLHPNGGTFIP